MDANTGLITQRECQAQCGHLRALIDERTELQRSELAGLRAVMESQFLSVITAIGKAEGAQREHNIIANEFRGQLKDQASQLMPRFETEALVRTIEDKISILVNEISGLREFRSIHTGKESASAAKVEQSNWIVGIIVALVLGMLGSIGSVIALMDRVK